MKKTHRLYSRHSREALKILGNLIAIGRKGKHMTAVDLSKRCKITRQTLSKVERGEPSVEIGIVFEAAAIVGVPLFQLENPRALRLRLIQTNEQIALLPRKIRKPKSVIPSDEF